MEPVKVRIVGLSCAHRKGRNTAWLVQYALQAVEKFGRRISDVAQIETEFIDLADKSIKPCLNCDQRWEITNQGRPYEGEVAPKPRGCIIRNDYFARELMPRFGEADGFIFGSPVYTFSYTSKFRLMFERLADGIWEGCLTNKPAAAIAVATMPLGGQETCLQDMNNCIRAVEMVPVPWPLGAPGISGPPYGPIPADDDGAVIGVKRHRYAQWLAVLGARRVAEFAVMWKIARRQLGELYNREFVQLYHPPHGDETWAWSRLDEAGETAEWGGL